MSILNKDTELVYYSAWLREAVNIKDKSAIQFCLDKIFKLNRSSTMLYYTLGLDVLVNRARGILREEENGTN